MGQRIIAENAQITDVTYKLPNKHYVPVDMKYIGIDNMSPYVLAPRSPFLSSLYQLTNVCARAFPGPTQRCSCRSLRPGTLCYEACVLRFPTPLLTNDP